MPAHCDLQHVGAMGSFCIAATLDWPGESPLPARLARGGWLRVVAARKRTAATEQDRAWLIFEGGGP